MLKLLIYVYCFRLCSLTILDQNDEIIYELIVVGYSCIVYILKNITNILCKAIIKYTHETILIILLKLINIIPQKSDNVLNDLKYTLII